MEQFARENKGKIRVVGIGVGGNDASYKKFAQDYGVTTNVLMASGGGAYSKYGQGVTPASVLTDNRGNVIKQWKGTIRNFQDVLNAIP